MHIQLYYITLHNVTWCIHARITTHTQCTSLLSRCTYTHIHTCIATTHTIHDSLVQQSLCTDTHVHMMHNNHPHNTNSSYESITHPHRHTYEYYILLLSTQYIHNVRVRNLKCIPVCVDWFQHTGFHHQSPALHPLYPALVPPRPALAPQYPSLDHKCPAVEPQYQALAPCAAVAPHCPPFYHQSPALDCTVQHWHVLYGIGSLVSGLGIGYTVSGLGSPVHI